MTPIESLSAAEMAAHVHWVRRVARALVRGDGADDVEQETWLSALRHPQRHDGDRRRWLSAVARNVVRKLARGTSRREAHESRAAQEAARTGGEAPASDLLVARAQVQQRVAAAVLELAEPYRSTLLARYFEELPPAAIAAKLGAPVETVKTRLKRGLEQLRERLGKEIGEEDTVPGGDSSRSLMAALSLLDAPIDEWLPDAPPADAPPADAAETITSDAAASGSSGAATIAASSPLLLVAAAVVAVAAIGFALSSSIGDDASDAIGSTASVAPDEGAAHDAGVSTEAVRVEESAVIVGDAPAVVAPAPAVAAAGTIRGVVVGPDGEPVGGATLWLDRQSEERLADENAFLRSLTSLQTSGGDPRYLSWRVATSADDGSFLFADVARDGCFAIGAVHDTIGCGWTGGLELDAASAEVEAFVELRAGIVIHGTVRDADGAPIGGAGVMFDGSTRPWVENADRLGGSWGCDGEGRYRTAPLPWRWVQRYAGGFMWQTGETFQPIVSEPLAIPEGVSEWQHDVVLTRAPRIEGRFVDTRGAPASLATSLLPRLTEGERLRQSRETTALVAFASDPRVDPSVVARVDFADGSMRGGSPSGWEYGTVDFERDTYRITLAQAELRWLALVARDGVLGVVELPPHREIVDAAGPDLAVDLSLLAGAPRLVEIDFHARDVAGEPLPYVAVTAFGVGFDVRGRTKFEMVRLRPLGSDVAPGALPIDEAADQRLAIEPGEWWLECGRGQHATRYVRVSASRGMEPIGVTVVLEVDRASLAGIVLDAERAPVGGAALRLYRVPTAQGAEPITEYGSVPGTTDPSGRFSIPNLPAVPAVLVVSASESAPLALRVETSTSGASIEARLVPGYEVAIRLRRDDGEKVGTTRWQLLDRDGVPLIDDDFPRDTGYAHWSEQTTARLSDGDYRLIVRGPDGLRGEVEFTVATADDGRAEVCGPTVSSNGEVGVTLAAQ